MNRRWICGDVWMDILPSFDHAQLGLKMALISDRFDALVDTHFDAKTTEFRIWREIIIRKDNGTKAKLSEWIDGKFVGFPMPDHPLPNIIRIKDLHIYYIDHSVIAFLRANKHIWDRMGTDLELSISNAQPIWDVFVREIWPILTTNLRHLSFADGDDLYNLRRRISPTILTDLCQLNSIDSGRLCPDGIADDGPNASAGQALFKWLNTPTTDGRPKRLFCEHLDEKVNLDWVNSFKKAFLRATASVSYKIKFTVWNTSIEPFELVNERTKEKLTFEKMPRYGAADEDGCEFTERLLLKRCPISEKATAVQWENEKNWDDNLNKVTIFLWADINKSIGPLSPPTEEENEEADESNEK